MLFASFMYLTLYNDACVCVCVCVIGAQQNFQGVKILSISQKYGVNHIIFLMQIYKNLNPTKILMYTAILPF